MDKEKKTGSCQSLTDPTFPAVTYWEQMNR